MDIDGPGGAAGLGISILDSQLQLPPQDTDSAIAASVSMFSHAIETEPLASACIAALQISGVHRRVQFIPGSGLKILRLVSKQLNTVMTRNNIRGYTLLIDGVCEDLPDISLLKLTHLSCLRVVVTAGELSESKSILPDMCLTSHVSI